MKLGEQKALDCIWESEEARSSWEKGIPSATDKALAEEAMRYDSGLSLERERGCGSSHLILYSFDRTRGESSIIRVLEESNDVGPGMDDKGSLGYEDRISRSQERKRIDGKKALGQVRSFLGIFDGRVGKGNFEFLGQNKEETGENS
ncbi:hypothetical protein AAG906_001316 [Vitis piasezkii]